MTTATSRQRRDPASAAIAGAVVGSLVAAVVVVAVAGVFDAAALAGAATGAFSTVVVMAFGAVVVHVVAKAMPGASLLLALMTYALQVVSMTAFLAVATGSGALGDTLSGGWLVAGVVVALAAWVTSQIWFSVRARIPLYDLPGATGDETSSRGREAGQ